MNKAVRDITIFAAVTAAAGWIGVGLNAATQAPDPMQGVGALVWLLAPAFTAVILAILAGNWVRRLGLVPGGAGSAKWYVLALVVTPLVVLLVLPLGFLTGTLSLGAETLLGAGSLLGALVISSSIKNLFEELAWRGFLTPWFAEAGLSGLRGHLITGVIWAIWHVPYWLFFLDSAEITSFSGLPIGAFVVAAFVLLPLQAIFYGELRLVTGSIWPSWLLHTVSNVVSIGLLTGGLVVLNGPLSILLSPGTGGILYSVLLAAAGVFIYRRRTGAAHSQALRGAA